MVMESTLVGSVGKCHGIGLDGINLERTRDFFDGGQTVAAKSMSGPPLLQPFARNRLQSPDEPLDMALHIIALIDLVSGRPAAAVLLLKKLGVLFFDTIGAFQLSILSASLVISRGRFMEAFRRGGWEEASEEDRSILPPIVGLNEIKNWVCLKFPLNSPIRDRLARCPFLKATEAAFGRTHPLTDVLIGPRLPPPEAVADAHFPLVSLEYDRFLQPHEVADIRAADHKLVIDINVSRPLFVDLKP
jgi:hypothetical protein